jgi:hypothetical protein
VVGGTRADGAHKGADHFGDGTVARRIERAFACVTLLTERDVPGGALS